MIRGIPRQRPDQVVDISTWPADEDFPVFPLGSKPKSLLISPDLTSQEFLTPTQGYLFKGALGWQAQQMWCEVIAYEFAEIVGVNVPPAFVAIDATGQPGALIKWFYPYPAAAKTTRLVHAADFMQKNFADGKKGRPHALRENLALCRSLNVKDALIWWAEAVLFDCLIGNTDRHSENWGFQIERNGDDRIFSLAPLYDNGTSLGYGVQEAKLEATCDPVRLAAHIARGKHDIGWSRTEDGPTPHLELCERLLKGRDTLTGTAQRMLGFSDEALEELADWATSFDVPVNFSPERGRFIVAQISARRDALKGALGL